MDRNWYADFFRGIVVDMWRTAAPAEYTLREVDFLERELQLRPGQRVLDVPCGFGRHTIELARRGYRLTGVDISSEMLVAARQAAQSAGVDVEWRQAEMRDIGPDATFAAVFSFGNSFGYLDRDGTREFLHAVARALQPGGRYAFDYGRCAEGSLTSFVEREWAPVGDLYFLEENRYLLDESCVETVYTFVRNGVVETRTGLQWVFTLSEVRALLAQAGLTPRATYASVAGDPFRLGTALLIVVAEKT